MKGMYLLIMLCCAAACHAHKKSPLPQDVIARFKRGIREGDMYILVYMAKKYAHSDLLDAIENQYFSRRHQPHISYLEELETLIGTNQRRSTTNTTSERLDR